MLYKTEKAAPNGTAFKYVLKIKLNQPAKAHKSHG
jgi:hypothetical protein